MIASTASPYKFCGSVLRALGFEPETDGVELISLLSEKTGIVPPEPLLRLKAAKERFNMSVGREHVNEAVIRMLGIDC